MDLDQQRRAGILIVAYPQITRQLLRLIVADRGIAVLDTIEEASKSWLRQSPDATAVNSFMEDIASVRRDPSL